MRNCPRFSAPLRAPVPSRNGTATHRKSRRRNNLRPGPEAAARGAASPPSVTCPPSLAASLSAGCSRSRRGEEAGA